MVEKLAEIDRCEDGEINGEAQTKKGRCCWLSEQWMQGERETDLQHKKKPNLTGMYIVCRKTPSQT